MVPGFADLWHLVSLKSEIIGIDPLNSKGDKLDAKQTELARVAGKGYVYWDQTHSSEGKELYWLQILQDKAD